MAEIAARHTRVQTSESMLGVGGTMSHSVMGVDCVFSSAQEGFEEDQVTYGRKVDVLHIMASSKDSYATCWLAPFRYGFLLDILAGIMGNITIRTYQIFNPSRPSNIIYRREVIMFL
jgi:hypothetical protein